jgi:hypothetical protein
MRADEQLVEFEWVVPESERDQQARDLEAAGGTVQDSNIAYQPLPDELEDYADAAFEPMIMIIGAVAAAYIVRQISRIWRDRNVQGGVVVDGRGGGLRIRRVPAFPAGRVVILHNGRTSVLDSDQEVEGIEELKMLLSTISG